MQNDNPYSQDFINQLHNAPKQPINKSKLMMIIGGGILALLFLIIIASTLFANKPQVRLFEVLAHTRGLEKITNDYHTKLSHNGLRATNSSLRVSLANFNRETTKFYETNVEKSQREADAKQKPNFTTITNKLDQAELNSRLDRTYVIEITYQLDLLASKQNQILNRAPNELKAIIKQGLKDIDAIKTQLQSLTLE